MTSSQCPRQMNFEKVQGRKDYVAKIAKEYKADGIIYEQMKFCDPWAYERVTGSYDLREIQLPVLTIDRPYTVGISGQLRTRVRPSSKVSRSRRFRRQVIWEKLSVPERLGDSTLVAKTKETP